MEKVRKQVMIKLTENEQKICLYLEKFIKDRGLDLTCRIAGAAGLESDDIDIALDSMTGHEFAEELKAWESSLNLSHPHKIGKIHANPEKSKHLETATIDLFGLSVDFVNLRQEEYASSSSMVDSTGAQESTIKGGSRIPTMVSFGTPLQDALRRDLTINSLFYNIHTGLVEDLTGKGISDLLESPLIRTPLDPHETFLDDPLRILRCIRFASKLEYPLADNIMPVVRERNIQEALRTKVSRERVGIEMDKIFKCKNPWIGLNLLRSGQVYSVVFQIMPEKGLEEEFIQSGPAVPLLGSMSIEDSIEGELDDLMQRMELVSKGLLRDLTFKMDIEAKIYYGMLCLMPFAGWHYSVKRNAGSKAKITSITNMIIMESLKWTSKDAKAISFILEVGIPLLKGLDGKSKGSVGLALKKLGPTWPSMLFATAVHEAMCSTNSANKDDVSTAISSARERFLVQMRSQILEHGFLVEPWTCEPCIRGNEWQAMGIPKMKISETLEKMFFLQFEGYSRDEIILKLSK